MWVENQLLGTIWLQIFMQFCSFKQSICNLCSTKIKSITNFTVTHHLLGRRILIWLNKAKQKQNTVNFESDEEMSPCF